MNERETGLQLKETDQTERGAQPDISSQDSVLNKMKAESGNSAWKTQNTEGETMEQRARLKSQDVRLHKKGLRRKKASVLDNSKSARHLKTEEKLNEELDHEWVKKWSTETKFEKQLKHISKTFKQFSVSLSTCNSKEI